jgi:hypothetical protein
MMMVVGPVSLASRPVTTPPSVAPVTSRRKVVAGHPVTGQSLPHEAVTTLASAKKDPRQARNPSLIFAILDHRLTAEPWVPFVNALPISSAVAAESASRSYTNVGAETAFPSSAR